MRRYEAMPFDLRGFVTDEQHPNIFVNAAKDKVARRFERPNSKSRALQNIYQLRASLTDLEDYDIPLAPHLLALGGRSDRPAIDAGVMRINGTHFSDDHGYQEIAGLQSSDRQAAQELCHKLALYLGDKLTHHQAFLWDIYKPMDYVLDASRNEFILVDLERKITPENSLVYTGDSEYSLSSLSDFAAAAMSGEPDKFRDWQDSLESKLGGFPRNPSVYSPIGALALSGASR